MTEHRKQPCELFSNLLRWNEALVDRQSFHFTFSKLSWVSLEYVSIKKYDEIELLLAFVGSWSVI